MRKTMNDLTVEYRELEKKQYMRRPPTSKDYSQLVKEPTKLYDQDGELVAVYDQLDEPVLPVSELKRIDYRSDVRIGGLKHTSRIFGYRPRYPLRTDFCASASFNGEYTEMLPELFKLCAQASQTYRNEFPDTYQSHMTRTQEILADWKIEGTPFTSGVINHTTALSYHLDAGNFKDVNSCMVVFKSKVGGGYLCLPEYGVALECSNHSSVTFDGQKIIHGVTPMVKFTTEAYRYSIVFYALEQLWQCLPLSEELDRIRQRSMGLAKERQNDPQGLPFAGSSPHLSMKAKSDAIRKVRAGIA